MPAVNQRSNILVTGASGFIAAWVTKTLLEQGFYVRGTVRSSLKGDYLAKLFEKHGDRFEYVVVEDIQKEGAFDEAVKGMDAVEHTASPFHLRADDPKELIEPAVKGTVGILESILKYGPSVQRVVITSSVAAIIEDASHQQILTEKNWNNLSVREVESKGREASAIHKYRASKSLAERSAWDFVAKHKGNIQWDVTTLNPPLVWGPTIHDVPAPASLNTSVATLYALIKGRMPITATPIGSWTDVRDLAQAHVDALTITEAGGERFIISSGEFTWQDFMDAVHVADADGDLAALPKGEPGSAGDTVTHQARYEATKAQKILRWNPRKLKETAIDSVRSLLEREKAQGW